ncbi:MAG: hypothetical protein HY226_00560, partial [Candidatus Vogelbacteria bacterium]|nr:hypothetical protein [Candidatus Vogelbacteria bacterium]
SGTNGQAISGKASGQGGIGGSFSSTGIGGYALQTDVGMVRFGNSNASGGVTIPGTKYDINSLVWTEQTSGAAWGNRSSFSSVFFNNRIWVMGGVNSNNAELNDVWSSADGKNWVLEDYAPWGGRHYHTSLVFNNKIWVFGGAGIHSDSNGHNVIDYNDVWSSSNGRDWTLVTDKAQWEPREGHSSVVFDGQMWVIGGTAADTCFSSNCIYKGFWSSSDGIII